MVEGQVAQEEAYYHQEVGFPLLVKRRKLHSIYCVEGQVMCKKTPVENSISMHTVATLLSNASRSLPKVAPTPYRKYEGHLPKECVAAVSLEPTSLEILNVIELNPLFRMRAVPSLPLFYQSSLLFCDFHNLLGAFVSAI